VSGISRRKFIGFGAIVGSALIARRAIAMAPSPERRLGFYNLHTGESYNGVYWANGDYLPDALAEVHKILRDFRTGEQHEIDRNLLDLLVTLRARLDSQEPFQVISGYRSPKTNAMLHEASHGVAEHSYHIVGKAIDIRVAGRALPSVRDAALTMRQGGVGYYPASDFVHVDVGPVRRW
jgi:uncharacterized protein YcbK (DUF882 family)